MDFDLENPLAISSDDQRSSISALFAAESDEMSPVAGGIVDPSVRREAASIILQAQFAGDLDPFVSYLAVNYTDRFLAKQKIPRGKPWIVRLLSVSCLSLASKMKKIEFSLSDFQRDEGLIYDAQSIQRMELLVLGALNWRMRSITPLCFLRFFISFFSPGRPPLIDALRSHASQILLKSQIEMKTLEFKPSELAAAAVLSAADELFPIQFAAYRTAVSSCENLNKEKLWECCNMMAEFSANGCVSSVDLVSSSNTPVTVLGHHQFSISEREGTVDSSTNDCDLKKRRISDSTVALQLTQACDWPE